MNDLFSIAMLDYQRVHSFFAQAMRNMAIDISSCIMSSIYVLILCVYIYIYVCMYIITSIYTWKPYTVANTEEYQTRDICGENKEHT